MKVTESQFETEARRLIDEFDDGWQCFSSIEYREDAHDDSSEMAMKEAVLKICRSLVDFANGVNTETPIESDQDKILKMVKDIHEKICV